MSVKAKPPTRHMLAHRDAEGVERFWRRMVGAVILGKSRQRPCRGQGFFRHIWWTTAPDPTHEAGLMLPEVVRPGQNPAVLHPDNLLVDEGPGLFPAGFQHRLAARGVPAIPGGIFCDGFSHGGRNEAAVEFRALRAVVPRSRHRIARMGNDLLKRQVDNVHGIVLGRSRKRNGVRPLFRFRRGVSGRQALVSLGIASKRNETGVFGGVTGKALRLAPPKAVTNRRDPFIINGLGGATFWVETVFSKTRSPNALWRTIQTQN